jgi:uncharacterized membrane protein YdjX (TVP38/TMEM64 family)
MNKTRAALLLGIVVLIILFFTLDLGRYLDLDFLKDTRTQIQSYRTAHPVESSLLYVLTYIVVTGLSLPGAAIMTLAGGAIFGLLWGTSLASVSSVIGATIAFLAARFLFRDLVQDHFAGKLAIINRGIEQDGAFYLFTLRLVPIFPYFIINIVMALTPLRTATFFTISWIGMLLPTAVFVNAGTQLVEIESIGDVLSPELIGSFALLGLFPLITRKLIHLLRRRMHKPEALPGETEDI